MPCHLSRSSQDAREIQESRLPPVPTRLLLPASLLPVGLTDVPYEKAVKLYCPRCEDIYTPKSSRHGSIDGAYFGTTFPHMLFMAFPHMVPPKSVPNSQGQQGQGAGQQQAAGARREGAVGPAGVGSVSTAAAAMKGERYKPKIFGFGVHETARWQRWQEAMRDKQVARLEAYERVEDSWRQREIARSR